MKDFLYKKVENYLLSEIKSRNLKPGMKILSERKIADKLNINRMTVKYAIDKLAKNRILIKIQGKGTYVSNSLNYNGKITLSEENPISMKYENIILGKSTYDYVVSFKLRYELKKLKRVFKYGTDFYELIRVRYADEDPYCVEYCYFPFDIFKDAIRYDFSKISIYDYMSYKKNLPIKFITTIEVVNSTKINNLVNLGFYDNIFKVKFYGFNENGILVEYTISYMNMNKVQFKSNYRL